ncbi:MAG: peptidylprolyl isomerase [Candidatus Omnitrophica bacterium]|nr:peptidylprolyl isomerase [Candidatus Omnitrophota bacterium]
MLRILRKKGVAKKILWVLAVMITVSFVFWGISSSLTRKETSGTYAGKIFGQNVSPREFENASQHVRNQLILRYGENFNKVENQINIESEAWDRLILIHEGKKRRIEISNQNVIAAIKGFPFFQRDKKFDKQLYDQIIQYVFRCTPRDFEEGIRESLIFEKIYKQEIQAIKLSDEDVLKEYNMENEKIQIDYIVLPFRNYEKGIVVTEEDLQQYYEKNKEMFQIPLTVNINYLAMEYPLNPSDDTKKKIADSAQDIAKDIGNNKLNLRQISEKYTLPMRESGFFSAENPNLELGWPLEVFQKALNLKKDSTILAFSTDKGFYFLELKDTREPRLLSFDEAKNNVKEAMVKSEAKKITEEKAKEILGQIQQEFQNKPKEKFETIVKKLGFTVEKTPDFTKIL